MHVLQGLISTMYAKYFIPARFSKKKVKIFAVCKINCPCHRNVRSLFHVIYILWISLKRCKAIHTLRISDQSRYPLEIMQYFLTIQYFLQSILYIENGKSSPRLCIYKNKKIKQQDCHYISQNIQDNTGATLDSWPQQPNK